ncbi:Ig-like domain-containing protein [Streptomyces mirabilis]|uniref:Ig-like domain-containing protein n=1 Tax=Streptomyces mirabilis TaxID=68239 RepID=UPI0033D0037A
MAACALLALGLVVLAMSQSQPARAASVGEFTMTPAGGRMSDHQPIAGSIAIPGACPAATIEDLNWNSVLALYVVKADGTEVKALNGITNKAPYTAATPAVSLVAADNPGMVVSSLSDAITGDGTYELRLRCVDNYDWAVPPDSIVPGDPYWTQKITVTGDNWVVGTGAEATQVALTASPAVVAPGEETTLTATVSPAAAAGTVTFLEGATTLGQATVASGKAEFKTSMPAEGDHSVTARFTPGNAADWGASESAPFAVTVQLPRYEMRDAAGKLLAYNPELQRGQTVKVLIRGCQPNATYSMTMFHNDATFPAATADASGTVTWSTLTVPGDAVAGASNWDYSPDCTGGKNPVRAVDFTVPEPSSGSPSASPTDSPTDTPSGEPTDGSSSEPTDGSSGDSSGITSGTTTTGGGGTGGDSTSGGTSPTGGLASTGSQIALFSGLGAVVLVTAGVLAVRYGRREGLLKFGDPRS